MDINQVLGLITEAAKGMGLSLKAAEQEVQEYALSRAKHLANIVGQPGWFEALEAEADAVVLFTLDRWVDKSDELDARLLGIAEGVLMVLAKVIL